MRDRSKGKPTAFRGHRQAQVAVQPALALGCAVDAACTLPISPRRQQKALGSREVRPGELVPALVVIRDVPGAVRGPHDLWHRLGEIFIATLAPLLEGGELALTSEAQRLVLRANQCVLLPELDERGDLRAERV